MTSKISEDLCRECVTWLIRCNAIPADHKVASYDSKIRVLLAMTLRDGVILCSLLHKIDPSAFDNKEFSRKPQMARVRSTIFFSIQLLIIYNICSSFYVTKTSNCSFAYVKTTTAQRNQTYLNQRCYMTSQTCIKFQQLYRNYQSALLKCTPNYCEYIILLDSFQTCWNSYFDLNCILYK